MTIETFFKIGFMQLAMFARTRLYNQLIKYYSFYTKRVIPLTTKVIQKPFNFTTPVTLGFSLYSLFGIEQLSEEDELVLTIKRSILLIQRNEFDKAEKLLHIALRSAQQIQNDLGITYIYDVMANLAMERSHLEKANKLFVSVMQRLMIDGVGENDVRIIHISLKLARISHLKQDFETANIGYNWCMQKLRTHDNNDENVKHLMALTKDWYARLLLDNLQYQEALNLLLESYQICQTLKETDEHHLILQLNDIATVYEKLNKLDDSERVLNEAKDLGQKVQDMPDFGAVYINLGRIYMKKGLIDAARKSCGYGWRLAHHEKNEEIKTQATECLEEINKFCS